MYNLFTTDDLDGVITAAYYHAVARHTKSGVHVAFCRDDLYTKVKSLSDTIAMARTWGKKLPDVRFIILTGVNATPETETVLDQMEDDDSTVCVLRESYMETTPVGRVLLHMFMRFYGLFHGREEAMYKLSDLMYNRLYGIFNTTGMS